ncbi:MULTISPECIES: lipoprotein-releasing ABC transporter permease subunit [unclassified Agarivorans]|uniref:lipoprotein-releasing ABC transporter permease subunit n=2 Tax=Bacteria TaxID=2 RepID=UPI0026E427D3|nr:MULTISPECIES: lipoprotein-releasing ABC transporter permease subunit [unclassified Agarivorans]MDO6686390.1 lipoprotein-releasing ABC transporter permease subunit [Agarivorans sp. 3_MG-2023]MDO6713692.1 lipoprotein-releasing ABC transporter permease subunit [Agarivorans sp. 2_MG-2023]
MKLIGFIAWRFSRGAKQQRFASFVSWFSTLGITLGVAALITVISVMNGFEHQLKQRILNLVPHLTLSSQQLAPSALNSVANAPLVLSEVVLQSSTNLHAAMMQGIDVTQQADAALLRKKMLIGDLDSLQAGSYNAVIGIGVANALGVRLGDTIRLLATDRLVYTPLGEMPSQRNFVVSGVFEFAAEVDKQFILVNIEDSARLLRSPVDAVSQQRYFLDDPFQIETLSKQLDAASIEYEDWRRFYGELFAAVKMEKNMMGMLFCLIIAVAAFNILSSLVMMVGEKRSDVAILQTLGLSRDKVVMVFVMQGAWSGCIGAGVGALSGWWLSNNINMVMSGIGLNFAANLGGAGLPVLQRSDQIIFITVAAMLLSIVATIYPAWRASKIHPAEALRYE